MPLKTIYKYIKLNVICHHSDLVLVCLALVIVFMAVLSWCDLNCLLLCPIQCLAVNSIGSIFSIQKSFYLRETS